MASDDADLVRSLAVVDATIKRPTASGDGFLRYNGDGYGDGTSDGHPWAPSNKGTGHVWPVLGGERGQWELSQGKVSSAVARLRAMAAMGSGVGLIGEQAWDAPDLARSPFGTDPTIASIGFQSGKPAGSASALTWSAAGFVRLMANLGADEELDRPAYTYDRYVRNRQGTTTLNVTAPRRSHGGSELGQSSPAHRWPATRSRSPPSTRTTTRRSRARRPWATRARFSVNVPLSGGTTVINIVATDRKGGTARAVRTVIWDQVPGTLLFGTDDPDGDDHGPGNYAYPTSSDFKPGAYDMQRFEVYDTGDQIVFRVRTRDLTPTFGNPFGAQLIDVYVHIPGAASTSTAAASRSATTRRRRGPSASRSRASASSTSTRAAPRSAR